MATSPALDPFLRPLRFAARNDFANLGVLKDLEGTLGRLLARADGEGCPPQILIDLRALLAGLDDLDRGEKRARVTAMIRIAEGGAEPTLETPSDGTRGPREKPRPSAPPPSRPPPADVSPTPPAPDEAGPNPKRPLPVARSLFRAAPKVTPSTSGKRQPMHEAEPATSLAKLVGVGPKTAERLAAKGIETVQDALFHLPMRYEDRSQLTSIADLRPGDRAHVQGVVAASALRAGRKRMWEVAVRDGTGVLSCRFFRFRRQDMESRLAVGTRVRLFGAVTFFGAQKQMAHPDVEVVRGEDETAGGDVRPVYPDVEGVPSTTLRKILQNLAQVLAAKVWDPMPESWRETFHLAPLAPAVHAAHLPTDVDAAALHALRRRLAFDELFYLQLALGLARGDREAQPGLAQNVDSGWRELAERALPFSPTRAQSRVLDEIAEDLAAAVPMSRMVQGDVGSGKTAVALLAAGLVAQAAGRQSCLLAPTEILAEQHARSAHDVFAKLGLQTALLTGSTPSRARAALVRACRRGDVSLVVGTHALLEPDVQFKELGLVIIDEQHRFGVEQRARLLAKREDVPPDVLVMTATPIPRTLTLSLYGDLRLSVIDELPPGRTPTETRVYPARQAGKVHAEARRALRAGRQVYIVFPLVEASDQLELKAASEAVEELREVFSAHPVELLHGKMRPDEKNEVMRRFARGEVGVLVATTVIEVGVDVPNATVMIIEEADRFGLSQLHQLRGRVGRGTHPGLCLLVAGKGAGAEASERLSVMAETTDGFLIAERDLQIRGPGEVLGTRQSGLPDLFVADLVADGQLLEEARGAVEALLESDPQLISPDHASLRSELERRFAGKLERLRAG